MLEPSVREVLKYLAIVGGNDDLGTIDLSLGRDVRMQRTHDDMAINISGLKVVKDNVRSLWGYFDVARKKPTLCRGLVSKDGEMVTVTFQLWGYPDRGYAEVHEIDKALCIEVMGQYKIMDNKIIDISEEIRPWIGEEQGDCSL